MAFLTLLLLFQNWFTELLGFLALGIESVLGVPQLYQNYKKKSTEGLR
ncbi:PQ-loop repeat-containing protein [Brasilonema sp. CT11]|nr:PQ-loop repeat-containing protein [Brasilonema sp. CT11]